MPDPENCPMGIRNQKDIQRLEEHFKVMLEHMQAGVDQLNVKMDNIGQKVDDLKKDIPTQIDAAVEAKWKAGVYDVIKWLVATVGVVTIGLVAKTLWGA